MTTPPSQSNRKTNPVQRAFILVAVFFLLSALVFPVVAARDVKVAIHELKPSLFTDDQGKPDGIFVDLIEDIAAKEGWNIVWVHGTFPENLDRLATGEIDLVIAITDTQERQKVYDFNRESAVATWAQVYAVPGKEINTILDLDGKRVAVLKGDINAIVMRDTAKKFNINPTYVERDTLNELFAETAAGNADAVVASRVAGQESAKKYGLSTTPVMFYPNSLGFAVPKGKNADLLLAIDRYLAKEKGDPSSHYSQTMQKWFGEQAGWAVPPWLWWGIAGILGLAALFIIMSVILRRQVRRKTAELADEMSKRKILIDQSRDGIVILDQQGGVYEANQRFAQMLGYTRDEIQKLQVRDWDARFNPDQIQKMIQTVDATGDHFESRHRRKDGTIIDVELSTNAAVFSGEKLIFCVVRDTSERKKAEAQLKRFNEDLQSEVKSRMKAESELVRKNEDLHAACGQLAATEEDLRENYQVLKKSEQALMQARKKLNLLNTLTFQDIQNGIFSLAGFIQLAKGAGCSDDAVVLLKKGEDILRSVRTSLDFAKKFQNLGISQPRWHDVNYTLVNAISHLDFSAISRTVDLGSLEIYADPLLEDVFLTLMENVIVHGAGATEVRISCRKDTDRITILVEDNGPGIPAARKEEIFAREYKGTSGTSLFFAREILSITDITLRETGEPGKGSRFEITVPEGKYRFSGSGG